MTAKFKRVSGYGSRIAGLQCLNCNGHFPWDYARSVISSDVDPQFCPHCGVRLSDEEESPGCNKCFYFKPAQYADADVRHGACNYWLVEEEDKPEFIADWLSPICKGQFFEQRKTP
jgi:hypothetical protein